MRPRKLTETVIQKYCDARAIGSSKELAATYAGVSYSAIRLWERQAMDVMKRLQEKPDTPLTPREKLLVKFLKAAQRAEAEAGITWQQVVHDAATQDPRWAAYMLERTWPDFYLPQRRLDVTTKGEPITHVRFEWVNPEEMGDNVHHRDSDASAPQFETGHDDNPSG